MSRSDAIVVLGRDTPARLVPAGTAILIPARTSVRITQSLGDSHTVVVNGNMARIDGRDADALGLAVEQPRGGSAASATSEDAVMEVLRRVYDPEIPVNIVDLGLIYSCSMSPAAEGHRVDIRMTLTSPQCGMGPILVDNIRFRVGQLPGISIVHVDIVFDPPWDQEKMTDEAKLELGLL